METSDAKGFTLPLKSRIKLILIVHALLALVPLGIRYVPPHINAVAAIWALGSINPSQLMLLAIYVAMFNGQPRKRLMLAALGVLYIAICQVISQDAIGAGTSPVAMGGAYLRNIGMDVAILVVLAVVLACTRGAVGSIRQLEIPSNLTDTRPQFSLLTLLVVLSLTALVMGLVRSTRLAAGPGFGVMVMLHAVLFAVVFGINIVATVWSTLGVGSVPRRLVFVIAVAAILGVSVGVSVGHEAVGWWVLASSPLVTLTPTAIIALTLLTLRPLGFRLTKLAPDACSNTALMPAESIEP